MTYTIPNLSGSGGIEEVGAGVAAQVVNAWTGILVMIFFVIWLAGYAIQDRRAPGNAAMWAAISAFITTTGAFILFLYDNLVSLEIVILGVIISIGCSAAFIISSRE